jgi:hypothetical protein
MVEVRCEVVSSHCSAALGRTGTLVRARMLVSWVICWAKAPCLPGSSEPLVLEAGQALSCCKLVTQQVLSQHWARDMKPVPYWATAGRNCHCG